jgi:hypothetical protein
MQDLVGCALSIELMNRPDETSFKQTVGGYYKYTLYKDASLSQNMCMLFLVQHQDHEWSFDGLVEDVSVAIKAYRKAMKFRYREELWHTEFFM